MSKFEVIDANLIATWRYKLQNSDCAICFSSLSSPSVIDLQKGNDSEIVIGICGHSYHNICITPCLRENNRCPLCSSKWEDNTPTKFSNKKIEEVFIKKLNDKTP